TADHRNEAKDHHSNGRGLGVKGSQVQILSARPRGCWQYRLQNSERKGKGICFEQVPFPFLRL
ncbi:hypothetical protein, partial [Microbacterium sp.]|uniref:hypothetical protein n=1 Tax=Microbacterium sp. TaxID=51671 RepID=UPI0028B05180